LSPLPFFWSITSASGGKDEEIILMNMCMRTSWIQREIVDMGKWLGLKNFDRRSIKYWQDQGVFPEPVAQVKGVMALYSDNEELDKAFIEIGQRMRTSVEVKPEDIKMAKRAVLEKNKTDNIDQLFKAIRNEKEIGVCERCGGELDGQSKELCTSCWNHMKG
jgi:hypothetical protein